MKSNSERLQALKTWTSTALDANNPQAIYFLRKETHREQMKKESCEDSVSNG